MNEGCCSLSRARCNMLPVRDIVKTVMFPILRRISLSLWGDSDVLEKSDIVECVMVALNGNTACKPDFSTGEK